MSFDDYNPMKKTPIRLARADGVPSDFPAPSRQTDGAGAYDLRAFITSGREEIVYPSCNKIFRTGFHWGIPDGMIGLAAVRSGLGFKHRIRLANCVGYIDSDFRGEVLVSLYNDSQEPYAIAHGERIAQMAITYCHTAGIKEVGLTDLGVTDRGEGGFGHTGNQ